VENTFDDIADLARGCKFGDCTHISEPDCKVLEALNSNQLDIEKYSNYLNLKKEVEHYDMTSLERREKDRKFGKFMKVAKKEIKKYKY
jgi:ribosome biogenesis GTPase